MHAHLFQHVHGLHLFERSRMAIEHHATAALILAIVIILGVGHALSIQSGSVRMFHFSEVSEVGVRLSRFADPQYAHETAAREQMMRTALEELRSDLQADRAYIAVYGVIEDVWVEYRVTNILEATKTGVAPNLQRLQGLGRAIWLLMKDNTHRVRWSFAENLSKTYGMELYDRQGTPIGYLGIENTQGNVFAAHNFQFFRETARSIEAAMLQPLKRVDSLKEL